MAKLIFTEYDNKIMCAAYEDNKMVEVSFDDKETSSILGNIYVGRVENIVPTINAAFVEYSSGLKGYYSLTDNTNHIFLNNKNTDKVCQGDLLLVQVEREAIKTKLPILTSNIELPGKYVVLTRNAKGISISSKIKDKSLKKEIKLCLSSLIEDNYGLIARTNCESLENIDVIKEEALSIINKYNDILKYACTRKAFTCMYGNMPFVEEVILNARIEQLEAIITDNVDIYNQIKSLGDEKISNIISYYQDELLPLYKLYSIENNIREALNKKVWLKSGGYLVIEPTEALTVIDVNTGKYINGKKDKEAGYFKVNLEAAYEIAKQIRLRNYSGIIIVDFIDMKDSVNNNIIMSTLTELFKNDPVKTTLIDMTKLSLVEITRKKIRKPLHEYF